MLTLPLTLTLPLSSKDKVLDLTEFVALLVRISFYRANPAFGLLAKASSP